MDTSELTTSVAYGPHRFETTNCIAAKLDPATSAAGQLRRNPFAPPTTAARYAGKMSESSGSCRPTIAESLSISSPVTPVSATIGTPKPPNATGAVFASSETITAFFGENPGPASKNAVTATGAPNPALPSGDACHQDRLHARVAGSMAPHPDAQLLEGSRFQRQVVEPQRVEHDPQNRPRRIDKSECDAPARQLCGHAPNPNRQDPRAGQSARARQQAASSQNPHDHQHHAKRNHRKNRRQPQRMYRRNRLRPDLRKRRNHLEFRRTKGFFTLKASVEPA